MKRKLFILLVFIISWYPRPANASEPDKDTNTCSQQVVMNWTYENSTCILKLSFSESEVKEKTPQQWQYFKTHDQYPFDEDFPLPEDLWSSLGSKEPIVIKTGSYPISYKNGVFEIIISL